MKKLALILLGVVMAAGAWAAEDGVNVVPKNTGLMFWTLATFLVMFFLLAKLAFKPIADALDRRGQTIKASLEEAERARAEAKKTLEQYQQQLAEARNEAKKIMEEARALGENLRKEIVVAAQAEAAAARQQAQEDIQREKEKSLQELQDTVARLSVQIAGKILEKEINEATHRALINSLIADLSRIRRS